MVDVSGIVRFPSTACMERFHDVCDGLAQVGTPDEPVVVLCGCDCHFDSTAFCEEGKHDACQSWTDHGSRRCDCPCHYRRTKAGLLELRERVG